MLRDTGFIALRRGSGGYVSNFVEVENKTTGNIELGVSAINAAGNESAITIARVYFDFTVPEAPRILMVED